MDTTSRFTGRWIRMLLAALLLAACGGDSPAEPRPEAPDARVLLGEWHVTGRDYAARVTLSEPLDTLTTSATPPEARAVMLSVATHVVWQGGEHEVPGQIL